jgi:Ca2+-binding RTX toxin-like protein
LFRIHDSGVLALAAIVFSIEQRDALEALTLDGSANFYAGYDYLRQELEALTPADMSSMQVTQAQVDGCIFWLTRASSINQNVLSDAANNFIRDITRYGLLWDDRPVGRIQFNSDAIGTAVIGEILSSGEFPDIGVIVGKDVQAAITLGGQTIAGWGGAFYYWDAPYAAGGPGATVGATIESDPTQLEKFISLASAATFNALARTFEDPFNLTNAGELVADIVEMLLTGASAAVPLSITWEIGDRVTDYITGTRQHFSDNPLFWDWERSIELSNAVGTVAAGQNGFEINLITGQISGFGHSREDFETFFRVENVKGSNLGDRITLNGTTTYVEVQAGSGDDKLFATGGTVVADGGGGYDTFVVNASFADVTILRTLDRLTFSGVSSPFTYLLGDFDTIQFLDQNKSFLELLASTVQEFSGSGDLVGTPWVDKLVGSAGRTVVAGLAGSDQISDPDWLVLDYSASDAGVTVNRGSFTNRNFTTSGGHAQGDAVSLGVAARLDVIGSEHNDTISNVYEVFAGGGDDIISEAVIIHAGGGYDKVTVSTRTNYIDFGTGDGELVLSNSHRYIANMEEGTFQRFSGSVLQHTLTVAGEYSKVIGSGYDDTITGTSINDTIIGNGGFDTLWGMGGDDHLDGAGTLYGGIGNDTLVYRGGTGGAWGQDGNDTITTHAQWSTLIGGVGDDTLISTINSVTLVGGIGADALVSLNGANTASYEYATSGVGVNYNGTTGSGYIGEADGDTLQGNFSFRGSAHADTFNVKLWSGNTLRAGSGNDTLIVDLASHSEVHGDAGDDTIITTGNAYAKVYGGSGNDTISGAGELHGDAGADSITSAQGDHRIYLGVDSDADTFVFSRLKGFDQVYDFTSIDKIQIGPAYKYDSFDDVIANAYQVAGAHVDIWFESDTKITIMNFQKANLTADNFLFD